MRAADKTEMCFGEIACGGWGVDWTELAQDGN
jgi:hypothetical protein